jgi:hypothetical protein
MLASSEALRLGLSRYAAQIWGVSGGCNPLSQPVSYAEGSAGLVHEDFAREIIEPALQVGADVLDRLVVDAGADQLGHPVDEFAGAEVTE